MQTQIDAVNGWEVERTMDQAMDALRCPPADAKVRCAECVHSHALNN